MFVLAYLPVKCELIFFAFGGITNVFAKGTRMMPNSEAHSISPNTGPVKPPHPNGPLRPLSSIRAPKGLVETAESNMSHKVADASLRQVLDRKENPWRIV